MVELLAPATAIIAAGFTIPVVLALYLLKLRRRPVRVSTVRFWPVATADAQANVPWRMLRPSWLLFLHLILATLLIIAAGRPTLPARFGAGHAEGERLVIVLDASASMSARDGGPDGTTRLEAAKALAREAVADIMRGPARRPIAVVVLAAHARLVTDFTTSSAAVRGGIDAIEPTDEVGNLDAACALLAALGGRDEDTPLRTWVFSDGALSTTNSPPSLPGPVEFRRVGPAPRAPRDNAGIVTLAARRDEHESAMVRVFVDLLSTAHEPRTMPLLLTLNGEVAASRAVELAAATDEPARAACSIEVFAPGGGVLRVSMPRDDLLDADNAAAVVIAPIRRPVLWLVRPEGRADDTTRPGSWLLAEALEELRPARLERMNAGEYAARAALGEVRFADLVLFDRIEPKVLPPCPTMHLGATPRISGMATAEGTSGADDVVYWDRAHPVLRYVALDALVVTAASRITISDSRAVATLAQGTRGPLIVLANDGGTERLIVGFDLSDSNWPMLPGFPVFLASAVDSLTRAGEAAMGTSLRAGEAARVEAIYTGEVVLRGPITITQAVHGPGPTSVGPIPRAGVYFAQNTARNTPVAVNVADAGESTLATHDDLPALRAPSQGAGDDAARREVWHWFVAVTVVLLLVEWVVYARATRV
ncbi:MAG: lipoprotein [Phycisphaerae bacterium]|nr:MAG: lipoprotein [Phycisphaerae bacterium]